MKRINLNDTTFIIPVRNDSLVRLENMLLTIDGLLTHFHTKIIVLEAFSYCNSILKTVLPRDVVYQFVEEDDSVFHKTKYLNMMAKQVTTENIGIWDADVITEPNQIVEAVSLLRTDTFDIVYPYDGSFLDTSELLRAYYLVHRNVDYLMRHKDKMKSLYSVKNIIGAVGGGIMAKTERYLFAGGENELFYGWGLEDGERHSRWTGLGYRISRINGPMFHLTHPRDINGKIRSRYQNEKTSNDFNETVHSTYNELKATYCKL